MVNAVSRMDKSSLRENFLKTRRLFGVVAGAAALTLAMSTQAYAADYSMKTDDGDPGGKVEFTTNGDVLKVTDIEADGWGVKAWVIKKSTGNVVYTIQAGGTGNSKTARASDGGSHNLAEDSGSTAQYKFRVCLHKENSNAYCDDANDWVNQ